jgi:peptidyl-prolyl cis-trans isomerase B (cyclophilin B)
MKLFKLTILALLFGLVMSCGSKEEKALNEIIKSGDIKKLEAYIANNPEGPLMEKANESLEKMMFEQAQTIFDYEKYLKQFPNGKYADSPEVQNAKAALEQVNRVLSPADISEIQVKVLNTPPTPVNPNEKAIIETPFGKMTVEFYPQKAPQHAANFKRLTRAGFYNGTTFHRVIPKFVIQGGDINSRDADKGNDGMGGPGYNVNAEFNDLKHEYGILSMARSQDPNSAGSQFFICAGSIPHLDGKYTVFGKVTDGLEVIEKIVNQKRDARDNPLEPVRMYVYMKE